MLRIRAGNMRHTIVFRRATRTQNAKGGYDRAWTTIATRRAQIEGLDGREETDAFAPRAVRHFRFTLRALDGLLPDDQAEFAWLGAPVTANIRSITDASGFGRLIQILADTASVEREP